MLATIPLLMIYGAVDCLIPVDSQACAMHDALTAEGAKVTALHLDDVGEVVTTQVPGRATLDFESAWPGANGFVDDHYLIIGDGQAHQLEGPARSASSTPETSPTLPSPPSRSIRLPTFDRTERVLAEK